MKAIFAILIFVSSLTTFGQDFEKLRKEQREKDSIAQLNQHSPYNSYNAGDIYLTNFIGHKYNEVMPRFQMFIQDKMSMSSVDKKSGMYNGWLRVAYTPNIDDSRIQRMINVDAKVKGDSNNISEMKITGDWRLIVRLFCEYWPTTLNFNNLKKGQLVASYYINEKIILSSTATSNNCTITVVHTGK